MFPDLFRDDIFRLETARFWLQWPRAADARRIAEYAGDPEVAKWTARIPQPYPKDAATRFIQASRATNLSGAAIVLVIRYKRQPDEIIGCVSLHGDGRTQATLGYWLGRPHWRKGLMSEAAAALVEISFRSSPLSVIEATVRPGNAGSRGVLERLGFLYAGDGVVDAPARGGEIPVARFCLTREAWSLANHAAMARHAHREAGRTENTL